MFGILSVLAVIFTVMMGFSLLFPILPFWALKIGATPFQIGVIFAAYPVAQFVFAPLWGKFSDKFGYKWGITLGALGFALTSFFIPLVPAVWYLILIRFLGGSLSSAALPSTSAYIGVVSPPDKVTRNYGFYGAAIGSGMIFGPLLGGFASSFGLVFPFVVSGIIGLLAFALSMFTVKNVKAEIHTRKGGFSLSLRDGKFILIFMGFLGMLIIVNLEAILALLIKDKFNYGAREVGYLMGIGGFFGAAVQANMGNISKIMSEKTSIFVGFLAAALTLVFIPFAPNFLVLSTLVVLLIIFSSIVRPAVLSLLSKGTKEKGVVMGAFQSAQSLGRIVGPPISGYLYGLRYSYPFYWAAALSLFVSALWIFYKDKVSE